jgi:hypothetical protein
MVSPTANTARRFPRVGLFLAGRFGYKVGQRRNNQGIMGMSGQARCKTVTFTRPANATAYTTLDAIGDTGGSAILQFPDMAAPGQVFEIISAAVRYDVAAVPASCAFLLALYNASPTAIADNAAWSLVAGDRTKFVGMIDLGAPTAYVATLRAEVDDRRKHVLGSASRSLYGILLAKAGFTPAGNSEVLAVTLSGYPV